MEKILPNQKGKSFFIRIFLAGLIVLLSFVIYNEYCFEKYNYDDYTESQNNIIKWEHHKQKTEERLAFHKKSQKELPEHFLGGSHDLMITQIEKEIEEYKKRIEKEKVWSEKILFRARYDWLWKWSVKPDKEKEK